MAVLAPALPFITLASMAVGTGMSVMGSLQQAKAAKAAGQYQNQVAQNNAIIAQRMANDAITRGKYAEQKKRLEVRQFIGAQRASLAANGVLVDAGSALNLTSDTAMMGEYDALVIRDNASREALGYETQASNFLAEGELAKFNANASASAARTEAFGSLISGAGSVASKWYDFNSAGAFDTGTTVPTYGSRPTGAYGIPKPGYIG